MTVNQIDVASAARVLARSMTERQLQDCVLRLARLLGWLAYHTHSSMHSAAGFPDICAVRSGDNRVCFVELKGLGKRPTAEQQAWLDALAACPGVEVYVWDPSDWFAGEVERVLGR